MNGKDAMKLAGIGKTTAKKIETKLQKYMAEGNVYHGCTSLVIEETGVTQRSVATSVQREKKYIPAFKSGPFAILLALYSDIISSEPLGYMTRSEICRRGQPFCSSSFEGNGMYTAWNGMKGLIDRGLVVSEGSPTRYTLSVAGTQLAESLWLASGENQAEDVEGDPTGASKGLIEVSAGSFEVKLVIDSREVKGLSERSFIQDELAKRGVVALVRPLDLGDFAWICKSKIDDTEVMCDYIVERKREDDFVASLTDGRYAEQKFRLKNCGLSNVFYLIEMRSGNDLKKIGLNRALAAMMSIRIRDQICLIETKGLEATIDYIHKMTEIITNEYSTLDLLAINSHDILDTDYAKERYNLEAENGEKLHLTFNAFNFSNRKTQTLCLNEALAKHLMHIKGVGVDKALAIANEYPTIAALMTAYMKLPMEEGKKMLANIEFGEKKRKIGSQISEKIFQILV